MVRRRLVALLVAFGAVSCSGNDGGDGADVPTPPVDASEAAGSAPEFVTAVRDALDAVEDELGSPQEYFEVTSNARFTNVFVAVDDATAVVAYAFVDGELQAPAPKQEGAAGQTFTAADVDFVEDRILSGVGDDLPESEIDAISVYGNGAGVTYLLAATSSAGGFLDIEVGPEGDVFSVDPV